MDSVSSDFNQKFAYFYEHTYLPDREERERPKLEMKGLFAAPNCKLEFQVEATSMEFTTYYSKAVNYVVMVALSTFVQIIFLIRQTEASSTQSVSLLTVGMQTMMDSYLCLIHLTTGIVIEPVFNAFATAAFFQFVLFSVFEMRFLLSIWKSRLPQSSNDWDSVRRELTLLYARFYVFLMVGFILMYYFGFLFDLFVFVMYSFYVPQIYCNATRDSNKALTHQYLIVNGATRLLIPLYFYACPYNFIHAEPHFLLSRYLVAWVLLQIIILYLQDTLGPRFFIPKQVCSKFYWSIQDDFDCVICMNPGTPRDKDYMITPCDHVFHQSCLLQWMEYKMECPTCRGALPNV